MPDLIPTIHARMIERDIKQVEMAKMLGVSQGAISRYLSGRQQPGSGTIQRWLDLLELEVRAVGPKDIHDGRATPAILPRVQA